MRRGRRSNTNPSNVDLDELERMVKQAASEWTGWDFPHDPGGIVHEQSEVVSDWDSWEKERASDLRESLDLVDEFGWDPDDVTKSAQREVAGDVAAKEREFGEGIQLSARSAALSARAALRFARGGHWDKALEEAKEASDVEEEYGDNPTYGPILWFIEEAMEEEDDDGEEHENPSSRNNYFVVPAPGYYGDRDRVMSSHSTLRLAKRAASGSGWVVREGQLRKGDRWLRVYEGVYPER